MRKSVILSVVLHALTGTAALLWALWYFIPVGNPLKSMITLLIIVLVGWLVWKGCRRAKQIKGALTDADLLLPDTQDPVVLVCGEGLDDLFQGQSCRKTAQGCWLRVGDVSALGDVVLAIQIQQPCQTGRLSVMYVCLPDKHQDEAVLRASVKALRQQIRQLSTLTGLTLPVILHCEFSGPETPWVIVRGTTPLVCPADEAPLAFADWQQAEDHLITLPILSQAFAFVRETLRDELEKADRLLPPVPPFAVVLRTGAAFTEEPTVWSHWLYRRTCLHLPLSSGRREPAGHFPDALLPLLSPFAAPVQGGQRTRRVIIVLWLCGLIALGFSAANNRDLIHRIGADL